MSRICLCIDLEGFFVLDRFVIRELGWCDWSGTDYGYEHYNHPWTHRDLDHKDRRTVSYCTKYVHGLPFCPRHLEKAKDKEAVYIKVLELYEEFRTPERTVIAYKGGHVERDLLNFLEIPHCNLESFHCPPLRVLTPSDPTLDCGCHVNHKHHCAMLECKTFIEWIDLQIKLLKNYILLSLSFDSEQCSRPVVSMKLLGAA